MNSLLNDDDDTTRHNEHELTLNSGMILVIFIGLVLLCGVFFGFGYRLGSHKAAQPEVGTTAENTPDASANFTDFKPAAGSPENSPAPVVVAPKPTAAERKEERAAEASGKPTEPTPEDRTVHGHAEAPSHVPATDAATPASAPIPTGTYFVQVAAVSHEEDAQLLIHALKAKGYPVNAHTQPQDKFFHIQVGPFDNHKDAEAAKLRLLADGYQPIIK